MKLAAVVIWFNPLEIGEEKIIQNILSYSSYCKKIYIVDNSSDLHEGLAKKIPNSIYISNKNVGGIAGGQNRGCERALNDGFEWAMTMDQDSIFEPKQIREYIRLVEEYIPTDEKAVSFGPSIKNLNETLHWTKWIRFYMLSPIKRKILGKRWKPQPPKPLFDKVERIIASANIINLSEWKKVGKFDEILFIDEVDYDLCYKFIRDNKNIIRFNNVFLNQFFGSMEKNKIIKRYYGNYSENRIFYHFRNALIQYKRYSEYRDFYKSILKHQIIDFIILSKKPLHRFCLYRKAYTESKNIMEKYYNV